jgi:ubiquinone/menaquinone biosynthesis C-methylase UbiE
MSDTNPNPNPSVSPERYTHDYFTSHADGHEQFRATWGRILPVRMAVALDLAAPGPGQRVLDVGCGRGELLHHSAARGAMAFGVDYAEAAIEISRRLKRHHESAGHPGQIHLQLASGLALPYRANSFDIAFLLDVVEHLHHKELSRTLSEIYRVLVPGGRLVVHTMPNLWYYRLGYPLFRGFQRLRGVRLPKNPRSRWDYSDVHVNEQTPRSLGRSLSAAGFKVVVWLQSTDNYQREPNRFVRAMMNFLAGTPPFRWIFCNDIFAVGQK